MAPELFRLGLLTQLDRMALAAYCQCWARWQEAEDKVVECGAVITTQNGCEIQSPWVGIANRALVEARKFAIEFGFTPASRSKVTGNKKPKPKTGWEDL